MHKYEHSSMYIYNMYFMTLIHIHMLTAIHTLRACISFLFIFWFPLVSNTTLCSTDFKRENTPAIQKQHLPWASAGGLVQPSYYLFPCKLKESWWEEEKENIAPPNLDIRVTLMFMLQLFLPDVRTFCRLYFIFLSLSPSFSHSLFRSLSCRAIEVIPGPRGPEEPRDARGPEDRRWTQPRWKDGPQHH